MPASSAGSVVDQEDQFDAEDDVVFVPSPKLSTRSSSFGKATAPSTSFKSFAPSQKWSAPSAQHAQPSPSASAGPPSAMPIKFSKTPPALRHRTLESSSGIRDKAGQALTKKPLKSVCRPEGIREKNPKHSRSTKSKRNDLRPVSDATKARRTEVSSRLFFFGT